MNKTQIFYARNARLLDFLCRNNATLPYGDTSISVSIYQEWEDNWVVDVLLPESSERLCVVKEFETEQEALDWLSDGRVCQRAINNAVKEELLVRTLEKPHLDKEVPESWSKDKEKLDTDYKEFKRLSDLFDKEAIVVPTGVMVNGEQSKIYINKMSALNTDSFECQFKHWVKAGRPPESVIRIIWEEDEHPGVFS